MFIIRESARKGPYVLGPGQTALTRMPLLICWLDNALVKATMAPLVEV